MHLETNPPGGPRLAGSESFPPPMGKLLLSLAVLVTLSGAAIGIFRGDGSSLNAWLFMDVGVSHRAAATIERGLIAGALLSAVGALILRHYRWGLCLMLPAFALLLTEACLTVKMGGTGYSGWAPFAHALRYATPLALAVTAVGYGLSGFHATWLLRIALASVFFTHGMEAWLHYPRFIDLIIGSAENLAGWRITEHQATRILTGIGGMDMALALVVLIRPSRPVLIWMAVWGFITAFSRVTCFGWASGNEVLVRTTHFMVPVVLIHSLPLARRAASPESFRQASGSDEVGDLATSE